MARRYSRWFPKDVKPVHVGVYQTNWRVDGCWLQTWAYWDGEHWGHDASLAVNVKPFLKDGWLFPDQYRVWRGLNHEAKAGAFIG